MPTFNEKGKPRVLVLSTSIWPSAGQLALALIRVGFEVATIGPAESPFHRIEKLDARFRCGCRGFDAAAISAIRNWSPDLLVCTDDPAVYHLHQIYNSVCKETPAPENQQIISLIEQSLGNPKSFCLTRSNSKVVLLAQTLGIRCPPSHMIGTYQELREAPDYIKYPILVKSDGAWGGRGIRLAKSRASLVRAAFELFMPVTWPAPVKRVIAASVPKHLILDKMIWSRAICLQKFVYGRRCNRAVVCWKGKVLSSLNFEVCMASSEYGPSRVVKLIEHSEMDLFGDKITETLGLSGFIGFDFILDDDNRVWFLEMNPRATPTCHLSARADSLVGALFTQITGKKPLADTARMSKDLLILFPGELCYRNDCLQLLPRCCSDAPVDDISFIKACPPVSIKPEARAKSLNA